MWRSSSSSRRSAHTATQHFNGFIELVFMSCFSFIICFFFCIILLLLWFAPFMIVCFWYDVGDLLAGLLVCYWKSSCGFLSWTASVRFQRCQLVGCLNRTKIMTSSTRLYMLHLLDETPQYLCEFSIRSCLIRTANAWRRLNERPALYTFTCIILLYIIYQTMKNKKKLVLIGFCTLAYLYIFVYVECRCLLIIQSDDHNYDWNAGRLSLLLLFSLHLFQFFALENDLANYLPRAPKTDLQVDSLELRSEFSKTIAIFLPGDVADSRHLRWQNIFYERN